MLEEKYGGDLCNCTNYWYFYLITTFKATNKYLRYEYIRLWIFRKKIKKWFINLRIITNLKR